MVWGALDDVVMGGVSESTYQIDPKGSENGGPTGLFKGLLFLNSGLLFVYCFPTGDCIELHCTVIIYFFFIFGCNLHLVKHLIYLVCLLQELFPLQITVGLQVSEQR